MAIQVYTNCKIFFGGYDLTSYTNNMSMELGTEMKDSTVFGSSFRTNIAGFTNATANVDGFWDAAVEAPDLKLFDTVGSTADVLTMCPTTGADGEVAFGFQAVTPSYKIGMPLGEITNYNATFSGNNTQIVRGTVLKRGTVTTSANGTAMNLGAISAGQYLYGAMHVVSLSGTSTPTLMLKIQSDDNEDFTSATDRFSFAAATAIGAEWATPVAGAITDDWWRATWIITGTDPSMEIIVVMGIK